LLAAQASAAAAARQKKLADMYNGNGSVLFADVRSNTIVLFSNRRCNLTYEVCGDSVLFGEATPAHIGPSASMPLQTLLLNLT
jgi:hypothetical protein